MPDPWRGALRLQTLPPSHEWNGLTEARRAAAAAWRENGCNTPLFSNLCTICAGQLLARLLTLAYLR